ncbi:MAG TPA: hypothetical protein VGL60_12625 [Acidimicrobiales bacterium]
MTSAQNEAVSGVGSWFQTADRRVADDQLRSLREATVVTIDSTLPVSPPAGPDVVGDDPGSNPAEAAARERSRWRHPSMGVPRGDQWSRLTFALDPALPVLLFRIGHYPLHHGTVGAIRSLGRGGVPVFAVTEDRYTPAALSRYLTGRVDFPSCGAEPQHELLDRLVELGRTIDCRPVLMCTDDEAAVLVAEGAERLREHFVLPDVPPALVRQLASKRGLHQLCGQLGVPTPATWFPTGTAELEHIVDETSYPVIVKNTDPWTRLTRAAVTGSTIVADRAELLELASTWREPFCGLVQEYLPDESSEDWIVHGYWGTDDEAHVAFSGRKLRSWPPRFGATAYAEVQCNEVLLAASRALCGQIGYRGIFDMDWRWDRRSGRYFLLDFNPRLGAQFRLFEDDVGIDVVRAMHLDLSGRAVPGGGQVDGERFVVENLDLAARRAYRRLDRVVAPSGGPAQGAGALETSSPSRGPRLAWFASDDLLPVVSFAIRQLAMSVTSRLRAVFGSARRRPRRPTAPSRRSES